LVRDSPELCSAPHRTASLSDRWPIQGGNHITKCAKIRDRRHPSNVGNPAQIRFTTSEQEVADDQDNLSPERENIMHKTIFALAAAALVGATTFAAAGPANDAGNYFGGVETIKSSNVFDIALVTTTGPGVVQLFDYNQGTQGALLGEVQVNAGANADLRVNLGIAPRNDVLAVLTIGGQVAATQAYDVTTR
jgi:hypothetical protein